MASRTTKLVLAAVLASSLPAAAAARDCEHDRDDHPTPVYVPSTTPAPPPAPAPRHWRDGSWRDGSWRDGSWRERELREVRAQLNALEQRRAEFHARNGWRPGKVRRFERWYAARRAELERRWYELQVVAWR